MQKFEYKCIDIDYSKYKVESCLRKMGEDGWELCASYEYAGIMLIFKREKKDA